MAFTKKSADLTPIIDTVFSIVAMAKEDKKKNGEENVTDATIGSLYDEEGKLVAFDTVFDHYDAIDHRTKAAYATSFTGNPTFRKSVLEWVTQGVTLNTASSVIATPGGSGAISMAITSFLDEGETLLVPNIAWGSYTLMAHENNMNYTTYEMFDGDAFNITSLKAKMQEIAEKQDRVVVVINSPCHNPTGYSLRESEWKEIIAFANDLAAEDRHVIFINDIAYIDYSNDLAHSRDYMNAFNEMNDHVMVAVAFSCSKTLTSYGLRCGAALILANRSEDVREAEIIMEKKARATWSNIPNAAMENFVWITNENRDAFLNEKQKYIDLMKQRSSLFLKEAGEVNLACYPYMEGFFVTLRMKDNSLRDQIHQALLDNHIYTVKVNLGIRVAVCSLPVKKVYGLAGKIKAICDQFNEVN